MLEDLFFIRQRSDYAKGDAKIFFREAYKGVVVADKNIRSR